jgi:hypothetical protein
MRNILEGVGIAFAWRDSLLDDLLVLGSCHQISHRVRANARVEVGEANAPENKRFES